MTRQRLSKPPKTHKAILMFPTLHQEIKDAVTDEIGSIWFHEQDSDTDSNKEYSTYVMGKFICDNKACSTGGWGSKKVTILIRGYPKNGYNALVFSQHCKSCNQLGRFFLDEESYVSRVAYRLKTWAGVVTERPYYARRRGLPHMTDLCEGCMRGICQQGAD